MDKIGFKKTVKHLYRPSVKDFALLGVAEIQLLMIDSVGTSDGAAHKAAVEWRYWVSYPVKRLV
jgi:hypothetical protein